METRDDIGRVRFYVCSGDEGLAMKECRRDQAARIEELEQDVEVWRDQYYDASTQLDAARDAGKLMSEELSTALAEANAEADLFHAAYVGMCAMHPKQELTIGHSQQEH